MPVLVSCGVGESVRLTELEPKFMLWAPKIWTETDSIAEAQGVEFLCPKCFATNDGNVGTHMVLCWSRSRGVPDDAEPGPGRWKLVGTGYDDLTLDADPPQTARSVLLTSGCGWHGFVTNGEIQ